VVTSRAKAGGHKGRPYGGVDMKYILMMNTMKAGQGIPAWPKQDLQAHVAFMRNFVKELHESDEFVLAEGLTFPD
jgi:hypothetical protein